MLCIPCAIACIYTCICEKEASKGKCTFKLEQLSQNSQVENALNCPGRHSNPRSPENITYVELLVELSQMPSLCTSLLYMVESQYVKPYPYHDVSVVLILRHNPSSFVSLVF